MAFDWSALITPAFITAAAGGLSKLAQKPTEPQVH
jgi:hypothetical protein